MQTNLCSSLLLLLVLLCGDLPAAESEGREVVCPPTALRVISYDSTLLPVENLTASSEDIEFNPVILLFGRNNVPFNLWCSDSDTGLDHHINVSFTQPVVITLMISSGFSNGYVSNFTVEYMEDNQSDFTFYEDSQEGKDFVVDHIDSAFWLESPFAAKQLRLTVNDGQLSPSKRVCWHLVLVGCTLDEALVTEVSTNLHYTMSTATLTPQSTPQSTQTATSTNNTQCHQDIVITVLQIALPTAIGTILVVMVITTVGVVVCLKGRSGKIAWRPAIECSLRSEGNANDTIRMVDNSTLYGGRSKLAPPSGLNLLTDGAYTISPRLQKSASLVDAHPRDLSYTYDQIGPADPLRESDRDSMVDNPNYNVPFTPTQPRHSLIDMVNNDSYTVPFNQEAGYCYANVDINGASRGSSGTDQVNVYDIPSSQ